MATGSRAFGEGGVKRCNTVGAPDDSDDCTGTDAPGSDSSEEERTNDSFVLNINASIL